MTYVSVLMLCVSLAVTAVIVDLWAAWHPTSLTEQRIAAGTRVVALGRDAVGQMLGPMGLLAAWALTHSDIAANLTSPLALNVYCAAVPLVGGLWGVAQLRRNQTVSRVAAAIEEFLGRGQFS